jgi:hypothetical protein
MRAPFEASTSPSTAVARTCPNSVVENVTSVSGSAVVDQSSEPEAPGPQPSDVRPRVRSMPCPESEPYVSSE